MEGVPLCDALCDTDELNAPLRLTSALTLGDRDAGAEDTTGDDEVVEHVLEVGAADDANALLLSVADNKTLRDDNKLGLPLATDNVLSDGGRLGLPLIDGDVLADACCDVGCEE